MTLTGCASLSAQTLGRAEARVTLPDWPAECRTPVPHAPLVEGYEARSVLKRERAALDRANAKITTCADLYDDLQEHME